MSETVSYHNASPTGALSRHAERRVLTRCPLALSPLRNPVERDAER
jgi:hypothetical protein